MKFAAKSVKSVEPSPLYNPGTPSVAITSSIARNGPPDLPFSVAACARITSWSSG